MPSIARKSNFKAISDHFMLSLGVQHVLHSPIHPNDDSSKSLPTGPGVFACNPLLFTLSGSRDGILATHDDLVTSRTTNYLVEYMRKNALELGLDTVSDIATSPDIDVPSFAVTFAHTKAMEVPPFVQTTLESLDLGYTWKTIIADKMDAPLSDACGHLFSARLTLPLETLLEDVVMRFVKYSLVKRYPFVFGTWAQQFNNETTYFRPLITSIERVINRSPSPTFRSQCGQFLKLLEDHSILYVDPWPCQSRSSIKADMAFYLAMQRVYKTGLRCTAFNGTHRYIADAEEQELLELGHQPTAPPLDRGIPLYSKDLLWDQGNDNSKSNLKGLSLLDAIGPVRFGDDVTHGADIDCLAFDTDDEVRSDLQVASRSPTPGISAYLDEFDPPLSRQRPVRASVDCTINLAVEDLDLSSSDELSGDAVPFFITKAGTGFCVVSRSCSPPLDIEGAEGSCDNNTRGIVLADHAAEQIQSDGTGASQAKGDTNHMASHLVNWRPQIAPKPPPAPASLVLDLEIPLLPLIDHDLLLHMEDGLGLRMPISQESRNLEAGLRPELAVGTDSLGQPGHGEFFDVLSGLFYLEAGLKMDSPDATIRRDWANDEGVIAEFKSNSRDLDIEDLVLNDDTLETVDDIFPFEDSCEPVSSHSPAFRRENQPAPHFDDRDEESDWPDDEKEEYMFVELVTY